MARNKALDELVSEHYDRWVASGTEFTIRDVIDGVNADPALASCRDSIVAAAIRGSAATIDQRRTATDQMSLFGDAEQSVPLGAGRRRRRGSMQTDDVLEHLALVESNARQVKAAADKERNRVDLLMPIMREHDCTWEEAERIYTERQAA